MAIAFVQKADATDLESQVVQLTLNGVSAGSLLVVGSAAWYFTTSAPAIASISSTPALTWVRAAQGGTVTNDGGDASCGDLWYAANATAGNYTVTVTYAVDFPGSNLTLAEFSGVATSSPLDQVATSSGGSGSTSTAPTVGPTATTTQADELVVAWVSVTGTSSNLGLTTPTDYTNASRDQVANQTAARSMEYRVVSATGAQSATWGSIAAAQYWSTVLATFKAAGGATDATVNLTGVSGAGAVGTLGQEVAKAVTGASGAGAVGTLGREVAKAITGTSGAGAVGTVAPTVAAGVSGVSGAGAAGTVAPEVRAGISGVSGSGDLGSVTVSISDPAGTTVNLSGVSAAGAVGDLAPQIARSITGVSAAGGVGSVGAQVAVTAAGVSAAGAVGTVTVAIDGADVTVALPGVSGSGGVGTLAVEITRPDSGVVGGGWGPPPTGHVDREEIRRRAAEIRRALERAHDGLPLTDADDEVLHEAEAATQAAQEAAQEAAPAAPLPQDLTPILARLDAALRAVAALIHRLEQEADDDDVESLLLAI